MAAKRLLQSVGPDWITMTAMHIVLIVSARGPAMRSAGMKIWRQIFVISLIFAHGVIAHLAPWSTFWIAVQKAGWDHKQKPSWIASMIADSFEGSRQQDEQYIEKCYDGWVWGCDNSAVNVVKDMGRDERGSEQYHKEMWEASG